MSKKQKVFVGLSGGVDSAVSAALLVQQGYEVVGVFIRIVVPGYPCTAGADRIDAMRVAAHLKIPFVEVDFSKEYEREVFGPSIEGFERGETPNPDVLCNREVKFGLFFEWARSRGADLIATGHYARTTSAGVSFIGSGRKDDTSLAHVRELPLSSVELLTGTDPNKDQSYFLWSVPEAVLRHTLFPVGDKTKTEVRALAKKFALPNAARPDSQGLCFLGPISIEDMLKREVELKPGPVLNEDGAVIGRHEGAARYTLGQRHGFAVDKQSPHTLPHFVIGKNTQENTVTVSTQRFPRGAKETAVVLREVNWLGEANAGPCCARFRYRQTLIPATRQGGVVILHEAHYVPVGQSLVLYEGDPLRQNSGAARRCLGGGIVNSSELRS